MKYALLALVFKFSLFHLSSGSLSILSYPHTVKMLSLDFFSVCLGFEAYDVRENYIACKVEDLCVCVAYNTQARRFSGLKALSLPGQK